MMRGRAVNSHKDTWPNDTAALGVHVQEDEQGMEEIVYDGDAR